MKRLVLFICLAATLNLFSFGQFPGQPVQPPGFGQEQAAGEDLPKFDLDFAGGPVTAFVEAVQKALNKVDGTAFLNVVIPTEYESESIPPLKLRNVNVIQLFRALEMASQKPSDDGNRHFAQGLPMMGQSHMTRGYGFQTVGNVTPESIWHFYVQRPQQKAQSKVLRYFQLAPYLQQFTMDDIGKAISAGWNMLDEQDQTQLNFHRDTKLLIAVGPPHQLETINMVLKELGAGMTNAPGKSFQERISEEQKKAQPMPKL